MPDPIIQLRDVAFAYPGGAFRLGVDSLEVAEGARAAMVGPSGIGKTTLVNLMAGILLPDCGSIRCAGAEVSALPDAARRAHRIQNIGFVFQEFELLEYLTAEENILLPFLISPALAPDAAAKARARDLAGALGIADKLARRPRELSQGERQRAAICRALAPQPRLLIADEPTGNLDDETAAAALDALIGHAGREGATLVMITHDRSLLPRFDQVIDVAALARANPNPGAAA
ncbi:MAG: ATP-binding cassette domain-containing protein [Verrucomicrobiales bacterium]